MTLREALDVMLDDAVVAIMTAKEKCIESMPCVLRYILRDDVLSHEVAVITCATDDNKIVICLACYGDEDY